MDNDEMRLLVVIDESELGLHAVAVGAALAVRLDAEITLHLPIPIEHVEANSVGSASAAFSEHQKNCTERAAVWFERAQGMVGARVRAVRTELTIDEEPCDAVIRIAREQGCGLIVVASQARGAIARALRGSLVDDLVRLSPRPVLVCRDDMDAAWVRQPAQPR